LDLRERVLADCDAGDSNDAVARKYRVSASWVRRLKQRRRETGSIAPRAQRRLQPRWAGHADEIRRAVGRRPDATLGELRQALGLTLSVPTLCRALQELRLTLKKRSSGRPNRTGRTSSPGGSNGERP
jgi:transposase